MKSKDIIKLANELAKEQVNFMYELCSGYANEIGTSLKTNFEIKDLLKLAKAQYEFGFIAGYRYYSREERRENIMFQWIRKIWGGRDNRPISELNICNRTYNALIKNGITTINQLKAMSDDELSSLSHIGTKGIKDIKDSIK